MYTDTESGREIEMDKHSETDRCTHMTHTHTHTHTGSHTGTKRKRDRNGHAQ